MFSIYFQTLDNYNQQTADYHVFNPYPLAGVIYKATYERKGIFYCPMNSDIEK